MGGFTHSFLNRVYKVSKYGFLREKSRVRRPPFLGEVISKSLEGWALFDPLTLSKCFADNCHSSVGVSLGS